MTKSASIAQKLISWRIWVQAGFLMVWLDPLALRFHSICGPVFHCHACPLATFACPIGVLAHFSALHILPFIVLGILVFAGAVFGGFICGWACPFGLLQDLIAKVPAPKIKLPYWISHCRYAVLLGLVLVIPFLYGSEHPLFFCRVCPAAGVETTIPKIVSQAVAGEQIGSFSTAKIAIVIVIVTAMFFIYRPWCRAFCPLGAIFGLFNRISAFFLRFRPTVCNSCELCHDKCSVGIQPEKQTSSPKCIGCLECTKCPPQALTVGSIFERAKAAQTIAESKSSPKKSD